MSDFRIDVVTIFPEYLAPLRQSLLGKAVERGLVSRRRPRPAAVDRRRAPHRRRLALRRRPGHGHAPRAVGPGAGRRPPAGHPAGRAHARRRSPSPRRWPRSGPPSRGWSSPAAATRASTSGWPTGRPTPGPVSEVSIGDYVLAGGESAVLVMVEAVTRLLPGVVGNRESVEFDSHADGLLEGPSYTRPASWRGPRGPAGAAVRRPRRDRPLAPRAVAAAHRRPAVPTCWPRCRTAR